jgi:hypothetical protein
MRARLWTCPVHRNLFALVVLAVTLLSSAVFGVCGRERDGVPESIRMEIITESGFWRCIEIPGFLIYTRVPDQYSLAFADELRRHNLTLSGLRAEVVRFLSTTNQIPVLLRLIPTSGRIEGGAPALPMKAYDDERALMYVVHIPNVVPAGSGRAPVAPPPVDAEPPRETLPSSINIPGIWGKPSAPAVVVNLGPPTAAEYLARDAFARRLRYNRPAPPEWLLHGMDRLMEEARIRGTEIEWGSPRMHPAMTLESIGEIFTAQFAEADFSRHEALTGHSALFLRWTLVGEPERRDVLWEFAVRAARPPMNETVFESFYGMSYGELGVVLTDSRLRRPKLSPPVKPADPQLTQLRQANALEIERLLSAIQDLNERVAAHNAAGFAAR